MSKNRNHSWDNGTAESIKEQPLWVVDNMVKGLELRAKAHRLEAQVEELKSEGNALLSASMKHAEVEKISHLEVGSAVLKQVTRETLDKDRLVDELIAGGVSTEVLTKGLKAAKKVTEFETVTFKPA